MKKITFILLALVSGTAFAQVTADATVSADIVSPLELTKVTGGDMNFGRIITSASAGTVVLTTDGIVDASSTADHVSNSTTSAAKFTIKAQEGYAFTITFPTDLSLSGGGDPMNITDINHSLTSLTGTGAAEAFSVGGTLNVNANQAEGAYAGTMTVTVDYQ